MIAGIVLAALLAGITSLDNVHAFQWMLSRPVVIGSLIGAVMGDLAAGMLCGACIELVWLGVLPIGNYTPPDAHVAAACAALAASLWRQDSAVELFAVSLTAVLLCLPIGILSKQGDFHLREVLGARVEEMLQKNPPHRLAGMMLAAVMAMVCKAAVAVILTGAVAIVLKPLVLVLLAEPRVSGGLTTAAALVPGLGMVQLARCIGARGRERYIAAGAALAVAAYAALLAQELGP